MRNISIEERLNTQLGLAESDIRELEEKMDSQKSLDEWEWRHIRQLSEEENLALPLPRMEIRYRVDEYNSYADYGLVIRHLLKTIEFIPFSSTRLNLECAKELKLPYRDGVHLLHDLENLKLPGYIVFKDNFKDIKEYREYGLWKFKP